MVPHFVGGLGGIVTAATIIDMIVVGNIIGVDALSAVAAILPVSVGAQFVSRLAYCGAGFLFAKYQGSLEPEKARRVVGLSLETAAAIGLAVFTVTVLGRDLYIDAMGLSGGVREHAIAYWRWIAFYYACYPIKMVMWRLVYADGETVSTTLGDMVASPLIVILSLVFTKLTGTAAGAAMGLLGGSFISDIIMMTHLFRKSNGVVPSWNFSWRGLRELVSYALTDSAAKLCQCGFLAVVNKLVVMTASVKFLPIVGMVALVQELFDLLDRVGDAYMPIAEMYKGERNLPQLNVLARHALSCSVGFGVLMVSAIELLAPEIVSLYGIPKGGEVFDSAVLALRLSGLVLPLASVVLFLCSHYLVMDRIRLSLVTTVGFGFLLPVGCMVMLCFVRGLDVMWLGFPIGVLLTLALLAVYCFVTTRRYSPLLLPAATCAVFNQSFASESRQVVRARDACAEFLRKQGIRNDVVSNIALLIEECAMAVADASRHPERVCVEISLIVENSSVTLILRDTGVILDLTDVDLPVTSLRRFVIASMMQEQQSRRYLNTVGCNRTVLLFAA